MGTTASIHITPNNVHILEGRLDAGNLQITNLSAIDNVSKYFNNDKLTDLAGLVCAKVPRG